MSKFLTPPVWYDKNGNLNNMLTGEASGNGVAVGPVTTATSKGVAVGYNAGAYNEGVAVGTYSTADNGIAVGYNADADNGIAIGPHAAAYSNGIAVGGSAAEGGIAIGGEAAGNGIAIGGTAAANKVQLGSTGVAYDLTVGNGSGTLGIGSIAFKHQILSGDVVAIGTSGVYLCCITDTGGNSQSYVAICFIDSLNKLASVLSSADVCYYSNDNGFIAPKNGYIIKYCFKIVSL